MLTRLSTYDRLMITDFLVRIFDTKFYSLSSKCFYGHLLPHTDLFSLSKRCWYYYFISVISYDLVFEFQLFSSIFWQNFYSLNSNCFYDLLLSNHSSLSVILQTTSPIFSKWLMLFTLNSYKRQFDRPIGIFFNEWWWNGRVVYVAEECNKFHNKYSNWSGWTGKSIWCFFRMFKCSLHAYKPNMYMYRCKWLLFSFVDMT